MTGIIRAEILRLRKRGSLLLIVVALPLLAVVFFGLGYASIYDPGPFDPARLRQELIDGGYVFGLPPDEAERQLDEYIANEARNHEFQVDSTKRFRATFTFPQSIVTLLGSAFLMVLALALLTATTIGDEFSWGTIRTTLLASSRRWRVLLVRLGALWLVASLIVALFVLAAAIAPFFLGVADKPLPVPLPPINPAALVIFVLGILLASFAIIAFASMATLIVRNGALTLVSVLVYVVVEGAILALLTRFETFGFDSQGNPGDLQWTLDALPAHAFVTLMDVGARASSAIVRYEGEVIPDIGKLALPLVAFAAWGLGFASVAFWRFRRMDIVE